MEDIDRLDTDSDHFVDELAFMLERVTLGADRLTIIPQTSVDCSKSGSESDPDDNAKSDGKETHESEVVAEVREWIDDEDDEWTPVDIMKLRTQALKQVKILCSRCAMKLAMHLTVVSDYVKL